jgi:hypothetical protein
MHRTPLFSGTIIFDFFALQVAGDDFGRRRSKSPFASSTAVSVGFRGYRGPDTKVHFTYARGEQVRNGPQDWR